MLVESLVEAAEGRDGPRPMVAGPCPRRRITDRLGQVDRLVADQGRLGGVVLIKGRSQFDQGGQRSVSEPALSTCSRVAAKLSISMISAATDWSLILLMTQIRGFAGRTVPCDRLCR